MDQMIFKWLKSENCSSKQSKQLGTKTRKAFKMTSKQYRKLLSRGREVENVLERLMSANQWNKIDFAHIPSKAGFIYKDAFIRHGEIAQKYENFIKDDTTTVNAKTLYPYECVFQALKNREGLSSIQRAAINKYWDNLAEYFDRNAKLNALAIVDTSGSMFGWGFKQIASAPIHSAIALGLYCASKIKGPFHGYFLSFSTHPTFIEIKGRDFCDKVYNAANAPWSGSTNIEEAFDLMLDTALANHCPQEELPENLIIISDMEFNMATREGNSYKTLLENIKDRWTKVGYIMPKLIFWNVDARQNNIPMKDEDGVTFVSGFSPIIFQMIMLGKNGKDLMFDKLDSDRYSVIG